MIDAVHLRYVLALIAHMPDRLRALPYLEDLQGRLGDLAWSTVAKELERLWASKEDRHRAFEAYTGTASRGREDRSEPEPPPPPPSTWNPEARFLEVYLGEARRRIEAAGPKWLERWQALALQLEADEEALGPWAAVEATRIMGPQIANGRWWDGSRWLTPEQFRAVHGRPIWEVEMEQLEMDARQPVDERPLVDAYLEALREGRWGGLVAAGYPVTPDLRPEDLARLLDGERKVQLGEWPEWASDEEMEESIRSLGPEWFEWWEGGAVEDHWLEEARRTAQLASIARVQKLRGGKGDLR